MLYDLAYHGRRLWQGDPLKAAKIDPNIGQQTRNRPLPTQRYCVYFTPRSSSTRLTFLLTRCRVFGQPGEIFNREAMVTVAEKIGARTLPDYVDLVQRARVSNGLFGFEVTYQHMLDVFGREAAFHAAFGSAQAFWLTRRDIVAQAVSVSRMVQSKAYQGDGQSRTIPDTAFRYDAGDIRRRIAQLRWLETRTELYFARFHIVPERLFYEDLVAMTPAEVAGLMATHLGLDYTPPADLPARYSRLGTSVNESYATRFRAEQATWLTRAAPGR